jgi:hypothetical protein
MVVSVDVCERRARRHSYTIMFGEVAIPREVRWTLVRCCLINASRSQGAHWNCVCLPVLYWIPSQVNSSVTMSVSAWHPVLMTLCGYRAPSKVRLRSSVAVLRAEHTACWASNARIFSKSPRPPTRQSRMAPSGCLTIVAGVSTTSKLSNHSRHCKYGTA